MSRFSLHREYKRALAGWMATYPRKPNHQKRRWLLDRCRQDRANGDTVFISGGRIELSYDPNGNGEFVSLGHTDRIVISHQPVDEQYHFIQPGPCEVCGTFQATADVEVVFKTFALPAEFLIGDPCYSGRSPQL